MKIERILWIGVAVLVFAQVSPGLDPKCNTKKGATTGEKAACVVTADFYGKHLASTRDEAVSKTLVRRQVNSVIQVNESNLLRLKTIADGTGDRSSMVTFWPCTSGPETKKGPSARCGEPVTRTLYFCVKTFPPDSANRIYHLSDVSPTCK
jgi:hypothetical protein